MGYGFRDVLFVAIAKIASMGVLVLVIYRGDQHVHITKQVF
jgi:hypothetical protein